MRKSIMAKILVATLSFTLTYGQVSAFALAGDNAVKIEAKKDVNETLHRKDAAEKYKWDLTDFYENEEAFNKDIKELEEVLLPKLASYKGKLDNAKTVKEYFDFDSKVSSKLIKAYRYASLQVNLDQTNAKAQELKGIAVNTWGKYSQAINFERPELLALPEKTQKALRDDKRLKGYHQYLDELIKSTEHILSEEEERILSLANETMGTPENVFDNVMYGDYKYPVIEDKDGNKIELNSVEYKKIMKGNDRELRKKANQAKLESYKNINNTLSATYLGEMKKNIFLAKARGYNSAQEASMSAEYIPTEVYDNLVNSINENIKYLHKYYEIRKNYFGFDEMYGYDLSLPLVEDYKMEFTYEEAVDMITKALAPLGEQYVKDFKNGIDNRWVDVYRDDHKYTGAFSTGAYGMHPVVLMNFKNDLDSALTLAHEMGHSLNTYYSNKNQNAYNAGYPIFTAEVASTANELLVMDYLIKNAKNDEEKLYLINMQLQNIQGTMYTQTMFAEFEKTTHEMIESGEPVSAKKLNELWLDLSKKYDGESVAVDELSSYTWTRIPHFYMNFYVYKYSTSMSASYELVNNMLAGKEGAVDKYLEFLGAGGSEYPIETLKDAGVDMSSSAPIDNILKYYGDLLDQYEELLNKVKENK